VKTQKRWTRRSLLRSGALLGGAALAAACAPTGTPQVVEEVEEVSAVPTERETAVTCIWRNNPNEKRSMEEAFEVYKQIRPNVTVEFLVVPSGNEGEQKLLSLFAGGTPPECFASVFTAGLVDYFYRDMVTDFVPYIERDQYDQSDFEDVALDTFHFGDRQVGMARGGVPTCLFLNLDLFDEAGIEYPPSSCEDDSWTWDKMVEVAKALTLDTDGDGRLDQYGLVFGNFNHNQFPMLWGTSSFLPEQLQYGIMQTHNMLDETVIASFQAGADLMWKDQVAPSPEASEALAALGAGGVFMSGRIAMYASIAGPSLVSDANFNWGMAPLPRGASGIQQRIMTWTGPLCMGWGCGEPEEGWSLIKFFVGEDGQKLIAPYATIGTSRKSLREWWSQQYSTDSARLLEVQEMGYAHGMETPNCRTVGWPEVTQIIGSGFDPLWLGEKTAAECVQEFAPALEAKLQELYAANVDTAKDTFPGYTG